MSLKRAGVSTPRFRRRIRHAALPLAGTLAAAMPITLQAADNHLIAPGTSSWEAPSTWSLGTPSITDTNTLVDLNGTTNSVVISNLTTALPTSLIINNLFIGGSATGSNDVTISATASPIVPLSVNGNITISRAGSLTVNGGSVVSRNVDIREGGITVNGGLASSNTFTLGTVAGKTGNYTQSGGTVNAGQCTLGGNGGIGIASVFGGTFNASSVTLAPSQSGFGALTVNGAAQVSVSGNVIGGGQIVVSTGNFAAQSGMTVDTLAAVNGGTVASTTTVKVKALTIGGSPASPDSKLDVRGGFLVVDYAPGALGTQLTDNLARVKSGRGTASATGVFSQTGFGINSSTAASLNASAGFNKYAVGIINNAELATPYTAFGGVDVDSSSVLSRMTYNGDANLDGKISSADYALINAAFAVGMTNGGWLNGDFTLDGVVNASDYAILDFAAVSWGGVALDATGPTAVPEPTGLFALSIAAAGAMTRRRRN